MPARSRGKGSKAATRERCSRRSSNAFKISLQRQACKYASPWYITCFSATSVILFSLNKTRKFFLYCSLCQLNTCKDRKMPKVLGALVQVRCFSAERKRDVGNGEPPLKSFFFFFSTCTSPSPHPSPLIPTRLPAYSSLLSS